MKPKRFKLSSETSTNFSLGPYLPAQLQRTWPRHLLGPGTGFWPHQRLRVPAIVLVKLGLHGMVYTHCGHKTTFNIKIKTLAY